MAETERSSVERDERAERLADEVVQMIADLPRFSPEDQPDMMLVTADELRDFIREAWARSQGAVPSLDGPLDAPDFAAIRKAVREAFDRDAPRLAQLAGVGGIRPAELNTEDVRHWLGNAVALAVTLHSRTTHQRSPDGPCVRRPDENGHRGCGGACYDCGRRYGDEYGFPDLVVPDDVWAQISPYGDDGGLLCPSCMVRRAWHLGLTNVAARFMSGPFNVEGQGSPDGGDLPALTEQYLDERVKRGQVPPSRVELVRDFSRWLAARGVGVSRPGGTPE